VSRGSCVHARQSRFDGSKSKPNYRLTRRDSGVLSLLRQDTGACFTYVNCGSRAGVSRPGNIAVASRRRYLHRIPRGTSALLPRSASRKNNAGRSRLVAKRESRTGDRFRAFSRLNDDSVVRRSLVINEVRAFHSAGPHVLRGGGGDCSTAWAFN
jgi:hypothetical protein